MHLDGALYIYDTIFLYEFHRRICALTERRKMHRYRRLSLMEDGGCGKVYAAESEDGLRVAIKLVKKPKREVEMLILCQDVEGVVKLWDDFPHDKGWAIVMERPYQCMDMSYHVETSVYGLYEVEANMYFRQIVDALATMATEYCVVHGDVKTENILVDRINHKAILIDFGSATFVDDTSDSKKMTRRYMTPEYVTKKVYNWEHNLVWCLGHVLYEMLTNEQAFEDEEKAAEEPLPPLPDILSDEVCSLVASCLEKSPAHRPSLQDVKCHPWLT